MVRVISVSIVYWVVSPFFLKSGLKTFVRTVSIGTVSCVLTENLYLMISLLDIYSFGLFILYFLLTSPSTKFSIIATTVLLSINLISLN